MLAAALILAGCLGMKALPLTHYASSSRLAEGRWRRIEVMKEGMQLITNAQLKAWGFSNPAKVNVYGYGGRRLSELLNTDKYIDDLPMQPVIRTSDGIIFYGSGTITWMVKGTFTQYLAEQNHFSDHSYYFLSDREAESIPITEVDCPLRTGIKENTTTFTRRLLHEKELAAPYTSGAWMLGEDFSQKRSQEFKFKLPGLAGDSAKLLVGLGAYSGDTTWFYVSCNGTRLKKSGVLPEIRGDETFINYRYVSNTVDASEDLTVGVEYSAPGLVKLARLGSITITYPHKLELTDGILNFYTESTYNIPFNYEISGCSATTEIWDVTNPAKPLRVLHTLKGDKALFSPPDYDYHEYIAFEPSKITQTPSTSATVVQNQDLHSVSTPDMVIITPQAYMTQARRIAQLHSDRDNMDVYIVTPEALYNEFASGQLDPTAFRKALKMWYDRNPEKLKYCLLLGRPTYDYRQITDNVKNVSHPLVPAYQSLGESLATNSGSGDNYSSGSYLTDDYITMLEDNKYSLSMSEAKHCIAVGRMPFTSQSHASQMVDKMLKYVEHPEMGNWRNHVMIIADNGNNYAHMEQSESSYTYMRRNGADGALIERIYLSGEQPVNNSTGREYPSAKKQMMRGFDQGTALVWYIGHANTREWTDENLFNYTDINSMDNRLLPVFMTATCQFTRWDDDALSGGEILWSHPESGAIALISTTRSVLIMNNGNVTYPLAQYVYSKDSVGRGLTLGETVRLAKNKSNVRDKLYFQLCGDPAMRLPVPMLNVKVTDIADVKADDVSGSEVPVVKGGTRMKLGGTVNRGSNVARDFSGKLYITLYDAERAIETQDPLDETNSPRVYNNRTLLLYNGIVNVENGHWQTEVPVPTAIENNYSPALFTLYAYSDEGLEANGYCDKVIIYGIDENSTDKEGPEITEMGLNSYQFKPGGPVSANPVFMASFTDPSGINQSGGGIGNEMTVSIDDKKYFTDLLDYYQPDVDNANSGSITYPLNGLEPGRHTLKFTVSDIHGNSTTKELDFAVTVSQKPILYDVTTDCNPATTSVTFTLLHDRLTEATDCSVDVYELSGRKIWSGRVAGKGVLNGGAQITWDLSDGSGRRVPRGIYLYRATVKSAEGYSVSKTHKLAVTAR